jgi:hypothetical protein
MQVTGASMLTDPAPFFRPVVMLTPPPVIPAKAGIQESRAQAPVTGSWIPAFAGMTDGVWRQRLRMQAECR